MPADEAIIRKTESVCPVCSVKIEASVIEHDGQVYLEKRCALHGDFSLLLSRHPAYYRELDDYYFSLMDKSLPQHDYIVHLTNRCELDCPICLAEANRRITQDYPLESLRAFLKGKKRYKIDLMGAEPTMRDDLPGIIKLVSESGNIAALHTNGIRISDYGYLKELKQAGLKEVHLQFDGFDDYVYQELRGRKLLELKQKALENLENLSISTDLVATIVRGVNEKEMVKILHFGAAHGFVKEIFFLGCRFLGKAKELSVAGCIMPDELIDILEAQTAGKISRPNVFNFQKIYFALLSAFAIRKCFYIQHFLIMRSQDGYLPVDQLVDLEGMQAKLDKFKELKLAKSRLALAYLFYSFVLNLVSFKRVLWLKEFLSFGIPFLRGFDLSRLPRKSILIGFISACDGYSFDCGIAQHCGKGAISVERGIQDTGAIDNVFRDSLISQKLK